MKLPYIPGLVCRILPHRWKGETPLSWLSAGRAWRHCTRCQVVQFLEGDKWVDRAEFLKTWKGDQK